MGDPVGASTEAHGRLDGAQELPRLAAHVAYGGQQQWLGEERSGPRGGGGGVEESGERGAELVTVDEELVTFQTCVAFKFKDFKALRGRARFSLKL